MARYDAALRSLGITIGQLDMLVTVMDLERASPSELARALVMERSTVSRNLARLEDAGLVRVADVDAHKQVVRLTRSGRRLIERAYEPWREVQADLRSDIGAEGVHALDLLVEKLGKER